MQKTKYPGVWKLPRGGYHVRTSAVDPRTGKLRPIKRTLPRATMADAIQEVARLRQVAKAGGTVRAPRKPTLTAFARSWLERHLPRMTSQLARERYAEALELHILPDLGDYYVDQLRRADLDRWLVKPRRYADGKTYSAHTVNGWWRILKMVMQAAAREFELPDQTGGVKPLPLPQREQENALTPEELRAFLDAAKRLYPQWHAFVTLGFTLGMRPGELRPLRWDHDVDLDAGTITVRQSQRRKYLGPTKTKRIRVIALPAVLVQLLREHRESARGTSGFGQPAFRAVTQRQIQDAARLTGIKPKRLRPLRWDVDVDLARGTITTSGDVTSVPREAVDYLQSLRDRQKGTAASGDLVFPSETGGFVSPSSLDKPFRKIAENAGIKKLVTPRAMRRTAQDLSRLAGVNDLVTRAISGHSDVNMQELYSTIRREEMRKSLTAVAALVGIGTSS